MREREGGEGREGGRQKDRGRDKDSQRHKERWGGADVWNLKELERKLSLTPVMIDSTNRGVLTGKCHLKNNRHLRGKIYVSIKHSLVSNTH